MVNASTFVSMSLKLIDQTRQDISVMLLLFSSADHAWKMLQRYLECFEESDARYHRCVCEKLLSQGFPLPTWLVNSYKVGISSLLPVFFLKGDREELLRHWL